MVDELRKITGANMSDYMKSTPEGDPYLDFSALSRDQTAALCEVTVEDYLDGRGEDARQVKRVKFKLHDKRAALVDLGRHLGLFVEKHKHDIHVDEVVFRVSEIPFSAHWIASQLLEAQRTAIQALNPDQLLSYAMNGPGGCGTSKSNPLSRKRGGL